MTLRLAVMAALLWSAAAYAQGEPARAETEIKAAFLYKFGDFIQWPPGALQAQASPFVIGVIGSEDMADALERVAADRSVQGHPLAVRRLQRGDALSGLQILFVGRTEMRHLAEILALASRSPILVVTDSESGLAAGSMINFVVDDQRVRFDIAIAPADRAQLKISSQLLAVARRVVAS